MMLLATSYLPSGARQASTRRLKLETPWPDHILQMGSLRWACSSRHGGYCPMEYGDLTYAPEMFSSDWPPPMNFAVDLEATASTEAAKFTLFEGTAHKQEWGCLENMGYDLYGPAGYTTQLPSGTTQATYGATLDALFAYACNASRLNLTLDTTLSRSPSPALSHTTGSDQLLINFLDEVCKSHTHLFYILEGTLYLVDCEADNGTDTDTDERTNMQHNTYGGPPPVSMITDGTNSPTFCSFPYGSVYTQPSFETNAAAVAAAQAKIKTIIEKEQITLRRVLTGAAFPVPGRKYTFTNEVDLLKGVSEEMRVREIEVDFKNDDLIMTGEGTVTAI